MNLKNTSRLLALSALATALGAAAASSRADDGVAFVNQHISDVVKIEPVRINDAPVTQVFGAPLFNVTVTILDGEGGTQGSTMVVAQVGAKLVPVTRPGSDGTYPAIQGMINPRFKLTTDADAKVAQDAFDIVYAIIGDGDKAARKFLHSGREWTFVRGNFFDKQMGFVLTTDANGTVTEVKYVLKLP